MIDDETTITTTGIPALVRVRAAWRESELVYQADESGNPLWPPVSGAGRGALEWRTSQGCGAVYAVTTGRRSDKGGPQHLCLVTLDEGFRMMSRVIVPDNVNVYIGMRVVVTFEERLETGDRLPVFVPEVA